MNSARLWIFFISIVLIFCGLFFYGNFNKTLIDSFGKFPINTATPIPPTNTPIPSITPTNTPIPFPTKLIEPLVDCVGPDGKHAKATKKDCDSLNSFWAKQTTTNNTNTTSNSNSSTPIINQPNTLSNIKTFLPGATVTLTTNTSAANNSGTISVSSNSVSVTLSKSQAQYGQINGSGFTITSQGATGWQIHYNEGTQGQGFALSSGGINVGGSVNVGTYISSNKSNGVYSGSAVVEYEKSGSWNKGPTVSYTITLVD